MMSSDKDPFEVVSEQTIQRAEAMCAGLESHLHLDRRGNARQYRGLLTDLDDPAQRDIPVTVAEVGQQAWVTVLTDRPFNACDTALLVFRMPPADDRKYLGRHGASRIGRRAGDDGDHYVLTFEIVRDVRKG